MKKKITIIDDDSDLRNLLKIILGIEGFDVSAYSNGDDFFKHNHGAADLYIIDINLGGISGLEMCRHLKSQENAKDSCVILISANPEIRSMAESVCADDTLAKPFNQKELIRKVRQHLNTE
jgi:DNA-binding response OmpR family regulator